MPAMDRNFCLQVPANSPMYQESPSAQAFQCSNLFVGAHVLGYRTEMEKVQRTNAETEPTSR